MTARPFLALFVLAGPGCGETPTGPTSDPFPASGRYAFSAEWTRPGAPGQTAAAEGELLITAASLEELEYRFTLFEAGSTPVSEGKANGSAIFEFVVVSPPIDRSGSWVLFTALRRTGSGYVCGGNAFRAETGGRTMTCTWEYLGA